MLVHTFSDSVASHAETSLLLARIPSWALVSLSVPHAQL
jgi:hypothetical protein